MVIEAIDTVFSAAFISIFLGCVLIAAWAIGG